MKIRMFSIYDSKAEVWKKPVMIHTVAEAKRMMHKAVNQEGELQDYAGDFAIWEIGEWDDNRGLCVMLEEKICHGLASDYLDREPTGQDHLTLEAVGE